MRDGLTDLCAVLATSRGEPLLRFLREVYAGSCVESAGIAHQEVKGLAVELGLLTGLGNSRTKLTPFGFLAANVAKEYCNWLDHGCDMPPPRPAATLYEGKDVLDLGCSFGRWLWTFQNKARSARGIEMQEEYIRLGRALAVARGIAVPHIDQGSAENLDQFVDTNSIDFVFARLVLNYVRIQPTLAKIYAVLRHNGVVWIQAEPLRHLVAMLCSPERGRRMRAFGHHGFTLLNSLALMGAGIQIEIGARGRMHSRHKSAYPALWWWQGALHRAGFQAVHVEHKSPSGFALWARKL